METRTQERVRRDDTGSIESRSVEEFLDHLLVSVSDFDASGECTCRVDYAYDSAGRNILRLVRFGTRQARLLVYFFDATGRQTEAREFDDLNQLAHFTRYTYLDDRRAVARVYGPDDVLKSEREVETWEI